MKKFIFISILSFCITGLYAQTSTKKYNKYRERYEYFDSSGNMIGYNKWNSYREQWEYTDLSKSNNTSNNSYISPYDTDMIYGMMQQKQARYDHNVKLFSDKVDELLDVMAYVRRVNDGFTDFQLKESTTIINNIKKLSTADFSNASATRQAISLLNSYIRTVKSWEEE